MRCKNCIALLLALVLLASTAFGEVETNSVYEEGIDGIVAGAYGTEDALYVATDDELFEYDHEDGRTSKLLDLSYEVVTFGGTQVNILGIPFVYGGKLMLVDLSSGVLKQVENNRIANTSPQMRLPALDDEMPYDVGYKKIFEADGELYALVSLEEDDAALELWRIDAEAGSREGIDVREEHITDVCAYMPGRLLALSVSGWGSAEYWIAVIDGKSGKTLERYPIEPPATYENTALSGVCYQPETGRVFFACENKLCRIDALENATVSIVDYYPSVVSGMIAPSFILGEDVFVLPSEEGLFFSDIGASAAKTIVRVAEGEFSDTVRTFMVENPSIAIEFTNEDRLMSGGVEEILTDISTGSSSTDIYVVHGVWPLELLAGKGYAVDLSESGVLQEAAKRMYPAIRDALTTQERLYAVPERVQPMLWQYNAALFERYGFSVPDSFEAYVDFLVSWYRDYSAENPNIWPTDLAAGDLKRTTLYDAIVQYTSEKGSVTEPFKFATPELISLLKKIDELPAGDEDSRAFQDSPQASNIFIHPTIDFEDNKSWKGFHIDCPPMIYGREDSRMRASLSAYIINPNSRHIREAIKYLEHVAVESDSAYRLSIYQDYNTPIEDKGTLMQIEMAQEQIQELEGYTVGGDMEQDIEAQVSQLQEELEYLFDNRYMLSPDVIARYDTLANNMEISVVESLFSSKQIAQSVVELVERHLGGNLSVEGMLKALDDRMMMFYLE